MEIQAPPEAMEGTTTQTGDAASLYFGVSRDDGAACFLSLPLDGGGWGGGGGGASPQPLAVQREFLSP